MTSISNELNRTYRRDFGVPYSACACPRKTSTATALAARMLKLTVTSKVDKAKRLLEQGTPESLEYQDASHPSDHNSVLVDRVAQVQRSYEYERLRAKEGHKRKGKGNITKETPPETTAHTAAFVRDERTAPSYHVKSALEALQAGSNVAGCVFAILCKPDVLNLIALVVGSVGFIPPLAFTALTSSRRVVAVAARVADPPCSRLKGSTTHHSPQLLQVRGSYYSSELGC